MTCLGGCINVGFDLHQTPKKEENKVSLKFELWGKTRARLAFTMELSLDIINFFIILCDTAQLHKSTVQVMGVGNRDAY